MITRREFLKLGAAGVAAFYASSIPKFTVGKAAAEELSQSGNLRKFIQPLRRPGAGIPLAMPDTTDPGWWQPGVTHYTIDIGQYEDQLHPDLPNPTRLMGFGQGGNFTHLGGVIAAKRGTPVQITFRNNLPPNHILPIDRTIMGAMDGDDRVDIHLHGGLVPWISDGGPHAWWRPDGSQGPSFVNNSVLHAGAAANEAEYYYPNNQGARLMWYHDHVFGLTRLNAYSGIATAYVIYDDYELELVAKNHLPGPLDARTVYLVFQDKTFVGPNTATLDPSWFTAMPGSREGDLWYAHQYDISEFGDLGPHPLGVPPEISCVPEFFGDTMLVNGTVFPYLEVERRQYRFRMLNACQARFLNPRLVYAQSDHPTEPRTKTLGPGFIQIGTEGGFLPRPVMLGGTGTPLLMSPAERVDVVVDFRNVPEGSTLILYNDAAGPYPSGEPTHDYYPGNPDTPSARPGFGPNTRTLMQFRVKARSGPTDPPIILPAKFTPTDPFLVTQIPGVARKVPTGIPVRRVTLNEGFDDYGRLIQMLGTDQPVTPGNYGRGYDEMPTEVIPAGTIEAWEIVNLTMDTHPMHFHLVNAQVLNRQGFWVNRYKGGKPGYKGDLIAPENNELGWKETVHVNPGQVTRVLMKFDLPAALPFVVPPSPRLLSEHGITGAEYVWHCHILEHEEHDMMRPLVIT